jgi:Fatty acid desaturase
MRRIDAAEKPLILASLAFPFQLGWLVKGSLGGALVTLVWAGLARIFLLHHATFSINSICHFFGRRRFATSDRSTNVAWLSLATFGESWHNNHHAFPHRRSTDFGAGSSTSATSSSVLSRRQGSRGRWCGSPQSASVRGPRPARRSGRRSA